MAAQDMNVTVMINIRHTAARLHQMQIPPRPDHLHGQNLPPRRTESAMLTEHYTTVVSNSPPELFHRLSGLQALACGKVRRGMQTSCQRKFREQFKYREFQNHST